jgi:4-amino-4-deoxy-L-arabinose transferase-like glycosyltransferase
MNGRKKILAFLPWSLIGLIVLVRLLTVFVMPWGQKVAFHLEGLNDEPAHFNYVKYLAVNKKFPVLEHFVLEEDAFTRNEFEYHQAPLYYLLCTPFYLLLGERGAMVAARLVSAFAGFLTLWVLALLLYDLGYSRQIRLAAIVFTGLLPSHLYFSSFVSNDPLSWLLALLFTRELMRFIAAARRSPCPPMTMGAVRAAGYLAAGLLTKTSFVLLFPVPGLLFGWLYFKHRDARFLWYAALIMAAGAAVAVPWYLRNIALYHTVSGIPPSTVAAAICPSSIAGLVKGTVKYFWFPMQHLQGGLSARCGRPPVAGREIS